MKKFILDANIDVSPNNKKYIKKLFVDLINKKNFKIVVGGSKLEKEYNPKFLPLLIKLKEIGKVDTRKKESVDKLEKRLLERFLSKYDPMPKECDDHHIFALSLESGCCVVVTNEVRMKRCIDKCRPTVGHAYCPKLTFIHNEQEYRAFMYN